MSTVVETAGLILAILATIVLVLVSLLGVRLSRNPETEWLSGFAFAVAGLFVIWTAWAAWQ